MTGSRSSWIALACFTTLVCIISVSAGFDALRPVFVTSVFFAGALLFWIIRSDVLSLNTMIVGAVLFRLILLWLPPALSDDVYRYLWDGRVQMAGLNPYEHLPEDLVGAGILQADVVYERLNSKDLYTVYPPVSQVVFAGAAGIEQLAGSWWYGYYSIKIFFALVELAAALLILALVRSSIALIYAWNPLVLVESAGQPHTESLLVLMLAGAVWFAQRGRKAQALSSLSAAVLVKLYPLFLIPLTILRSNWKHVAVAASIGLVFIIPFAGEGVIQNVQSSLDLYVRLFEFNAGFYLLVKKVLFLLTGVDYSKTLGPVFRYLFYGSSLLVWVIAWHRQWPFARGVRVILGSFLLFATTVHPWYLMGILCVVPLAAEESRFNSTVWSWYSLGIISMGTYLFYTHGVYWYFVIAGWMSWAVLSLTDVLPALAHRMVKYRVRSKYRWIKVWLEDDFEQAAVLDLGCGEGYLGQIVGEYHNAAVNLVDVVDFNKTDLPLVLYDGATLPYDDSTFETTFLYFVLHHAEDQERVLSEAVRVTAGRVIVVESTYTSKTGHVVLRALDRAANRLRSSGLMAESEAHLHFRTRAEWLQLFDHMGLRVADTKQRGNVVHRQVAFVLDVGGANVGE